MADWSVGGTDDAESVMGQAPPFDPSGFATVLVGERDGQTWELRDGPHAWSGDADAVGHQLVTRGPRGGGSTGAVSPRLVGDQHLEVGGHRSGRRGAEIAMLIIRCGPEVATVRTAFADGTDVDDTPTTSASTRERWAVVALAGKAPVKAATALSSDGATLEEQPLNDPRQRLSSRRT